MFKVTSPGGLTLAADEAGATSDPNVLLFHGGGQTRHAWGRAIQALAARHWHANGGVDQCDHRHGSDGRV